MTLLCRYRSPRATARIGLHELPGLRSLDHVARCPGGQRLADRLGVAVHRQHHDPQVGLPRAQISEERHRIPFGEREVEDQHLWTVVHDQVDRGGVVGGLTDDLEAVLGLQDATQPFADQLVVVDKGDPDHPGQRHPGRRKLRRGQAPVPSLADVDHWADLHVRSRHRRASGPAR